MRIPLTRYGLREILFATVVFGVLTAVGGMLFLPSALLPAAVWAYVLLFFRDPERRPAETCSFLAPADGKVVEISPAGAEDEVGESGVRIGIFMSLLDVHVNRSPCAASVARIAHHAGGYADARRPVASQNNESATIWLTHSRGGSSHTLAVRQIAGLIARRIVTDVRVGQQLAPGERIGMVKFGSRVELILPRELAGAVAVRLGQHVQAGRSVLVRLSQPEIAP